MPTGTRWRTRLTMEDHKPPVCAALLRMYANFSGSSFSGGARDDPCPTDVSLPPLMRLAEKYNMSPLLKDVQSALVSRLDPVIKAGAGLADSDVVDTVVIAERCHQKDILATCEAYLVRHLSLNDSPLQQMMEQKLSGKNLVRVAKGIKFEFCHDADEKDMEIVSRTFRQETQQAIASLQLAKPSCPRQGCSAKLSLTRKEMAMGLSSPMHVDGHIRAGKQTRSLQMKQS